MTSASAWFAGPKSENGDEFARMIGRIIQDYYYWRRNYFPEDGIVVDSKMRRENEAFKDEFEDRLIELLGKLKGDVPFHSPRYAAHMLSEQTLPSIAGYFAGMLYNPNNVSNDAAAVTVGLELEAGQMIARMLGYAPSSWAHLTSGGTIANFEALWIARTVRYLPFVVRDMGGLRGCSDAELMAMSPEQSLCAFQKSFQNFDGAEEAIAAYRSSEWNVVEQGMAVVLNRLGSQPAVLIPQTHHYSFPKLLDALGVGRRALVPVKVDRNLCMDVGDLREKIRRVRADGRHVLAVVAVMGTTEEGSIDPLDEILDLRSTLEGSGEGSFWIHADAAWGGYLRTMTVPDRIGLGEPRSEVQVAGKVQTIDLTLPERSACGALERLGECDSITIDPHKLGYVPYPAGAVCFKSDLVKPLARQNAPYLAVRPEGPERERQSRSIGVYILEGSRPGAAAAAVWLSHTLIPLDNTGLGKLIQQTVRNASEMHALLEKWPKLAGKTSVNAVPLCPPGSNVVCYAFRPAAAGVSLKELNALNESLYERFTVDSQEASIYRQRFFVSRTVLSAKVIEPDTVSSFLTELGVSEKEYRDEGVFLLRSVLMNPWYEAAKRKGKYFLSELVGDLYEQAAEIWDAAS